MSFTIISALLFGVTPILASMTFEMGSNANTPDLYRNLMVVPVLLCVMFVKKSPSGFPFGKWDFCCWWAWSFVPAPPICCMNPITM